MSDSEDKQNAGQSVGAGALKEKTEERKKLRAKQQDIQSQTQSQSRGRRGPIQSQPPSDTDSAYRNDLSQTPKRNRKGQSQHQQNQVGKNGLQNSLQAVNEADDAVNDMAGAGNVVGGTQEAKGNEQLRLRLDINLEIEVQLKAKIHGDLTLGLLN